MSYQFLLPCNLSAFLKQYAKDESQLEEIASKISQFVSESKPLKKKRFGAKEVYTWDINIGRHFHRALFDLATVGDKKAFVLRSLAWAHNYDAALNWSPL